MIIEEGGYTYKQALAHFQRVLEYFKTSEAVLTGAFPTNQGFSDELDAALWKIAGARIDGVPLQPFIDNAWVIFQELFPSIT